MKFKDRAINVDYRLTDLEDDLVSYINAHKDEVIRLKMTNLAQRFYTVPNTITRFCHKLGYEGFVDLKNQLRWELETVQETSSLLKRHYLIETLDLIDPSREEKCIAAFQAAKAVTFFAVGQTGELSKICVNNFYAFDPKFNFIEYPNTVEHKIEQSNRDVFFFVSLSGETIDMLRLAEKAKQKGHIVISLTGLGKNSLSTIADISLFCQIKPEIVEGYDVTDKTPLMIIFNNLFHAYLLTR